jgi:hypothetical protein
MLALIRAVGLAGLLGGAAAGVLLWTPILVTFTLLAAARDAVVARRPRPRR